ncbi:MAG: tripartite tricarboxylate transporter substrate binding protein [Chloroflexi bacterium]|nr:MAG: tripartite tricarboxylate transporter substrate binding protein [Chloroflexota bacterium]TMG51452.1 MAG: tripartite tricarboxylate transporter substrate binding protein [Chloroflexota bacterium]
MEVRVMTRSVIRTAAILVAALVTLSACATANAPSATPTASLASASAAAIIQPTHPVEFVISTAPGGGSDMYARAMATIIETKKFSPQPVTPLNKEGGSGAVAFQYVFEKTGDMHYVMITLNSFFTTIITQKLAFKATDFTPVANLALDPFFLWVNDDSPWKTAQDFIDAAKKDSLTVAGTGAKQEDEALFRRIQDTMQTKPFTYISQTSGATVAAAVAGHQGGVVASVNNPSEGLQLYQAKKMKPLCAFMPASPTTAVYASLPTCKSQGIAIDDYFIMRAIMAPPGLSAGQQAFWVDVFKKVYDSDEWKKFMSDNALQPDFKSGLEFRLFIQQYQQLHQDIATKFKWV